MKLPMSRRGFLSGLGIGAATLALPFVRPGFGRAGVTPHPRRFIAIFTPNGTLAEHWATGTERGFTLGPILRPLAPFRDRLLVLRGLSMDVSNEGPGGGHQKGIGALLTGQSLLPGDFCGGNDCESTSGWAGGISVDQHIAARVGAETRFGSLELGVGVRGSNNRHRMAYRGSDDPIPPESDPWAVYQRLFGDLTGDPMGLRRLREERRSVLDLVRGDLEEIRSRLGTAERHRFEAHLASLRDVESRLDAAAGAACVAPSIGSPIDLDDRDAYPELSRLQLDLLASAVSCDLTRVATVLYSGATSSQSFPWLDIARSHHDLSHEGDSNTQAQDDLVRINAWYAEQVAYLLGKLDAIPEGDGTALDNTIVFWGNELGRGNNHRRRDMSFLVAGNAAGAFRTGRLLQLHGKQHNDLLVSFCHAMGLDDVGKFGDADYCSGPLTGLTA